MDGDYGEGRSLTGWIMRGMRFESDERRERGGEGEREREEEGNEPWLPQLVVSEQPWLPPSARR